MNAEEDMMEEFVSRSVFGRQSEAKVYLILKRIFFYICKFIGLFHIAKVLTRNGVRIICYHGFSLADESSFSPRTFMPPETFAKRLKFLSDNGFNVYGLEQAMGFLNGIGAGKEAVVITIDDGFFSTYKLAFPILKRFKFPATVYITTYYVDNGSPIFGLIVQYLFWKTEMDELDLEGLLPNSPSAVSICDERDKQRYAREIIDFGEAGYDEHGRKQLLEMLGERLRVDCSRLIDERYFGLMNPDEIREMHKEGIDIQLHTHNHRFPRDKQKAIIEIESNRAALEKIIAGTFRHFCYPNGIWSTEQLPWLEETGMRSAVTCDRGLNYSSTPKLALRRVGDDGKLSQIEFEAEIYGFAEVLRRIRSSCLRVTECFRIKNK